MAASGIKACEAGVSGHILKTEKTVRLINLAHDMAKQVVGRKYGKGNQIEIKVGIHVGRVIAGVIGHHKPQFSLIGDPVNQTSRVGSTGDAGAITLSEQAFNKAKKDINYYTKKQKEAKGLGIINTFQVFQEKPPGFVPPLI
jgi:phospholipid-translocating ATPase